MRSDARFWTYVRDSRPAGDTAPAAVWFSYSPDRKGEHPQRHLAKFRGVLQADAFAGFNKLYDGGAIQEAPCMAHTSGKNIFRETRAIYRASHPQGSDQKTQWPDGDLACLGSRLMCTHRQ